MPHSEHPDSGGSGKATVLVSGGMDSTTLLHHVARHRGFAEIFALSFEYGQKHARELRMAEWQCAQVPGVVAWKSIDIGFYGRLVEHATALTGNEVAVPDLAAIPTEELDQPITYVPNRNMIMLSIAAGYAESTGCSHLFYGAQAQDEYGYWDCSEEFVRRLNQLLALNRRCPVHVEAPFAGMRKAEELRLGLELGIDYAHTWTCYRGGDLACGSCPSCEERLKAFAEVGIEDPLPYRQR